MELFCPGSLGISGRNTEFDEKQNDYRIEFRMGYYF